MMQPPNLSSLIFRGGDLLALEGLGVFEGEVWMLGYHILDREQSRCGRLQDYS